ncbi:hypothetical protein MKW94_017502, partial [Papaver nudicaule]|nr:hypothetical protein [Papaver nudicaule]
MQIEQCERRGMKLLRGMNLSGEVIPSNNEFRVAMEEASRVGAVCSFIDQDINVTLQQLHDVMSSDSMRRSHEIVTELYEDFTRSNIQERRSIWRVVSPVTFKVLLEDRDEHMFKELRRFQGKIVAVVGMAHMDGIELLWKRAENGDGWQPPASQKCGLAM